MMSKDIHEEIASLTSSQRIRAFITFHIETIQMQGFNTMNKDLTQKRNE